MLSVEFPRKRRLVSRQWLPLSSWAGRGPEPVACGRYLPCFLSVGARLFSIIYGLGAGSYLVELPRLSGGIRSPQIGGQNRSGRYSFRKSDRSGAKFQFGLPSWQGASKSRILFLPYLRWAPKRHL